MRSAERHRYSEFLESQLRKLRTWTFRATAFLQTPMFYVNS